jgi:anti-anti-sigma factor
MAQFTAEPLDGIWVIRVAGEVDMASTDELMALATDCLARGDRLRLDLGAVSFIDSSGLGILLKIRRRAADTGKGLTLASVGPGTQRLLQVTGLYPLFEIEPSPGETTAGH